MRLDERYRWECHGHVDINKEHLDDAHDGMACRVLRAVAPGEAYRHDLYCWIIFDDGYITLASGVELKPLPRR